MSAIPRHLRPHAEFGDEPSGWCGCAGCDGERSGCSCSSCVEVRANLAADEIGGEHVPDWADWSDCDDRPTCTCGFNGTPEECARWRAAAGASEAGGGQ